MPDTRGATRGVQLHVCVLSAPAAVSAALAWQDCRAPMHMPAFGRRCAPSAVSCKPCKVAGSKAHCRPAAMAPRTRGRAHQPTVPSRRAASFADLPDEVLVRCLGLLDLRERCAPRAAGALVVLNKRCIHLHERCKSRQPRSSPPTARRRLCRQRAALVCKRFAAAACSPELLQEVDVGEVKEVAALHSLSAWLARRGRHMQRLLLSAQPHSLPAGPDSFEAALTGCLHAAASSAARLVRLTAGRMVTSTGWLAGLPSLQQLELQGSVWSTPLHLSPAISGLAALGSLHLDGMIIIDHGLRLPTTITQLHLASHHSLDMPAQVRAAACWLPCAVH